MTQSQDVFNRIGQAIGETIVGQEVVIRQLLVALLSGGHVILEGVPGVGKTLTVKVLARLMQAEFRRIQLTPDILPSDILGTNVFDLNTRSFTLKQGPVFCEVLLADEINRTPPKTQAALLEAMEERQVTLDGQSLRLPDLFWTIATQNSLEFEGTYPLPEAQLDRFLFKVLVEYPEADAEKQMLLDARTGSGTTRADLERLEPIATVAQILAARQAARAVTVKDVLVDYLLELVRQTRQHADLALGTSPRAAVAWLRASQAHAWLAGRDYATPDDIRAIALPLLRHRLILNPEAQLDGIRVDDSVAALLERVPVPR